MADILGTEFNDLLTGTDDADVIAGGGGADRIYGGSGQDTLDGGAGDDVVVGGAGNDLLIGGEGDDILIAQGGNDIFDGGAGNDNVCFSALGTGLSVDLERGVGQGALFGPIWQFTSIESVTGSAFRDALVGDENANWFSGLAGDDVLDGRGGNDVLRGFEGADTLVGGAGVDELYGGEGADVFRIIAGTDRDYVGDFIAGEDRLDVRDLFESAEQAIASSWMEGAATVFQAASGELLILQNVDRATLSAGDFVL